MGLPSKRPFLNSLLAQVHIQGWIRAALRWRRSVHTLCIDAD